MEKKKKQIKKKKTNTTKKKTTTQKKKTTSTNKNIPKKEVKKINKEAPKVVKTEIKEIPKVIIPEVKENKLDKYNKIIDSDLVDKVLDEGRKKTMDIASSKILAVYAKMGLGRY